MSSAPTSIPSPAASSEAFAQPSPVNHGVSDHLSSGLFQPLQLDRESECYMEGNRRREGQKRENHVRRSGGSLNPFAKEFVPVGEPPISGRTPNSSFDSQFYEASGRNKGSFNGSSCRPRGGHDGSRGNSVIFSEDVKMSSTDYKTTRTPLTSSGGALATALRKGVYGQMNQRAADGDQFSSMRIPADQACAGRPQASGAGTTPPGNRKGQGFNANHLLNFQYDPIPRPPARAPRRARKSQPYNKELFLQANFRFLVSDFGDYVLNASDPDKMLEWEDVAAVNVAAPEPVHCPICLDLPLCPQITTCGHIFCFPCILRYLLMGVVEIRIEHWKKCPLCFATISSKELRTVLIDDVHQHFVGDKVKFTLLIRAKGSIIPFEKTELTHGPLAYSNDGQCHPFSKFTLTSDAESTTSKAVSELSLWAERVRLEGGEDTDLLPFVFVAIEHLWQRKEAWTEHRALEFLSSSTPVRRRIMAQVKSGIGKASCNPPVQSLQKSISVEENEYVCGLSPLMKTHSQGKLDSEKVDVVAETEAAMTVLKERAGWVYESAFSDDEDESVITRKARGQSSQNLESRVQRKVKSSGHFLVEKVEAGDDLMGEPGDVEKKDQDTKKDLEERESYTFYQSADGQILILHPVNIKCLLHHFGSYEGLPTSLEAELVELETVTQTDLTRKRYRYLSHLPLTAVFQLCEVDLSKILPTTAFVPFAEEIRSRENRRRRILKQYKEKRASEERTAAAEATGYAPTETDFAVALTTTQIHEDQLGNSPVVPTSPLEYEERKLFSRVAKMGFASGYDAPDLMTRRPAADTSSASSPTSSSAWISPATGTPEAGTSKSQVSFADIIVAQGIKAEQEGVIVGSKAATRKGKKASKVIMSTAGGRRY